MESSAKIQRGPDEADQIQAAVDIVDHYANKIADQKQSECSDSETPVRPMRKHSDTFESQKSNEIIESLLEMSEYSVSRSPSRKCSEASDSFPMKPSRKTSQTSNTRKFSVCSDTSSVRPKKVSFSDELPLAGLILDNLSSTDSSQSFSSPTDHAIEITSDYLENLHRATDGCSSGEDSPSLSTPVNELSAADMFPNSRKLSIHSERSVDLSSASTPRSEASESTSPMDTFLDSERRMSTSSMRSNRE